MKLNVPERIVLLSILPQQGNFATLKIIRELQMRLSFSEKELKHFGIKNTTTFDGKTTIAWNPELTIETKDVKIGEMATSIIIKQLKQMDEQGLLPLDSFTLYEKFMEQT